MSQKTGITIGKTRTALYKAGRVLGDINAVARGTIAQRVVSRGLGNLFGQVLGGIVRAIFGGRR